MNEQPSMFILEDDELNLEHMESLFARLPPRQADDARISGFEIVSATHAQQAWEQLQLAHRRGHSFDVAVFDLGVPVDGTSKTGKDRPHEGIKLLERLSDLHRKPFDPMCGAIVVSSAHLDKLDVLEALLRLGTIFDFRQKPWGDEDILDCVVRAYLLAQRQKFEKMMADRRLKRATTWFAPQFRKLGLEEMEQVVAVGLGKLRDELSSIEDLIAKRFQINIQHEPEDSLSKPIRHADQILAEISDQCSELINEPTMAEVGFTTFCLDDVITECVQEFHPGIASRQIAIKWQPSERERIVTSIRDDVQSIVAEILFGAVDTRLNKNGGGGADDVDVDVADIEVTGSQYRWEVRFQDRSKRLDREMAEKVKTAVDPVVTVDAAEIEERAWGLSLANRMAQNLGASIEVSEADRDSGNTITLYLPLMDEDRSRLGQAPVVG